MASYPDNKEEAPRRRWSYQHGDSDAMESVSNFNIVNTYSNYQHASNHAAAVQYGNMALEYDIIRTGLQTLQKELITELKTVVKCEVANILFVNDRTRNLSLYVDDK